MIARPVSRSVSRGVSRRVNELIGGSWTPPSSLKFFDFTKNRYSEEGSQKTLVEMDSDFIRLSPATKWQDEQLVQVSTDVPRISGDGLLIEPQATNLVTKSTEPYNWISRGSYTTEFIENIDGKMTAVRTTRLVPGTLTVGFNTQYTNIPLVVDYIGKETDKTVIFRNNTTTSNYNNYSEYTHLKNEVIKPDISRRIVRLSAAGSQRSVGDNLRYYVNGTSSVLGDVITMYAIQILESETYSSLIITGDSPATRSPDILNIPLLPTQTLTGDWDAGVTYSVADGIATFTGHGYIRNITVEEL